VRELKGDLGSERSNSFGDGDRRSCGRQGEARRGEELANEQARDREK